MSNVVYKFNCSRDADLSRIDMTTHHLSVRVREHLHSKVRSAVGKNMDNCHECKEKPVGVNDFKIMSARSTEYNTKIQEALLMKKCNPKLNSLLYANGSSFFVECILTRFYLFVFLKYLCYVVYLFSTLCDGSVTCSMNFLYNCYTKIVLMLRTVQLFDFIFLN